jgi:hypothetical protein
MITDFSHPTALKLAVQRGLLGNISANLAGVHAKLEGQRIVISAYFFNDPGNEDRQYIEEAAAEVIGDFPESYELETRYELLSSITLNSLEWNFLRAEAYALRIPGA